jgi:hypothetical protein
MALDLANRPCWDSPANLRRYILSALGLGLPTLQPETPNRMTLGLCAFGPSLVEHEAEIAAHQGPLWCVNGAHDWLLERNIIPHACVLLDSTEALVDVIRPVHGVTYYVASQCHPDLFAHLKDFKVVLWHAWVPKESTGEDIRDLVTNNAPAGTVSTFVSGGGTAALRCFSLGKLLGHRNFIVWGLDSSFKEGRTHATEAYPCKGTVFEAEYGGKVFTTNGPLAAQADNFERMYLRQLNDCRIEMRGDGLIPHMARTLNKLKFGAAA